MDSILKFSFLIILPKLINCDKLIILHSPKSLHFSDTGESVPYELLGTIYSASLGHSVKPIEWSGLSIRNPVTVPSSIFEITMHGLQNFNCANYPKAIEYTLESYEPNSQDPLNHLDVAYLNMTALLPQDSVDIIEDLAKNKNDVYSINFDLSANDDSNQILCKDIQKIVNAFSKVHNDVLVTAVTSEAFHKRVIRQAGTPDDTADVKNDGYTEDFAAIFNIILWFSVVFAFSLVAIVYALMDMDPGRDSIIYRMTSTRMKKDN